MTCVFIGRVEGPSIRPMNTGRVHQPLLLKLGHSRHHCDTDHKQVTTLYVVVLAAMQIVALVGVLYTKIESN